MLSITIFLDSKGDIASFEAQGHVNYKPHGEDVVCAGASSVILTAILGCTKVAHIPIGIEQEDGYIYFSLPTFISKEDWEKAQWILKTMLAGLEEIQKQYPQGITINKITLET